MRCRPATLFLLALTLAACLPAPATLEEAVPSATHARVSQAATAAGESSPMRPSDITCFVYQLQRIDLQAIARTPCGLVVIDYSADGTEEGAFHADQIAALREGPGGHKAVLAYLSIGEAEDYRFYWQEGWDADHDGRPDAGAPTWLEIVNPDWEGNYKVRYWDPAWQAILFGSPASYLDRILAAGFDGIYLDIIDAYEYFEGQGRSSAASEMADLVLRLAAYARSQRPGFLVFPQNAPELATLFPDYLAAIDGIGQEDLYYGYPDQGDPSPPDFIHEIEPLLDRIVAAGKPVLAIAYTTDADQIADSRGRALARGYLPLATVRALDLLIFQPLE